MTTQPALFALPGERPDDAPARDAIRAHLDATMFVEAGAGTGKTGALVERIVELVTADGPGLPVPMANIAAITFTEKAATELRDRIRRELQRRCDDRTEPDVARARAAAAVDALDGAAIGTLHGFARRILTDFPIEAGLPPRIVVRDEISSRVAFEARWRAFVDELLEDAELEQTVLVMLAANLKLDQLRVVAQVLDDNWDLLDRVPAPPPLPALDLEAWLAELDAVCASAAECRIGDDNLAVRLGELEHYRDALRNAFDDADRVALLHAPKPSFNVRRCGRAGNWPDIEAVRARVIRLDEQRAAIRGALVDAAIKRLVAAVARCTEHAVAERRAAGELEFHDLLVLARAVLRDDRIGSNPRAQLRARYQRILIDEFQDTDPIQIDLAALLGAVEVAPRWQDAAIEPGRVFFVGDPKQSIYRFRRADIATFLDAAAQFAEPAPAYLTCNFRTAPAVLAWINHVFAELIRPAPGSQPEYRALDAARAVPSEHDHRVVLLGAEAHTDATDANDVRAREAADVAAAVRRAVAEQWPIYDTESHAWRPARLGDICILLPARTSLGFLEHALDAAAVPYRAETSSLVYGSREVRDLLAALRAIDDPSDELSLVSALRSSLFGCGDDDLFEYHVEHGGKWDVSRPLPDGLPADHPVRDALRVLGALHDARVWSTPSELLERLVRECRVIEVGALGGRFREVARRVRFVVDQARAFEDAAGGTLRDYLAWAEMQGAEGARVVEAVLPETDDDAVRILTIHGAKGLEFPIVICSGTTTAAQAARKGVQVLFPPSGGCEVKLSAGVQTAHFELYQPVDEQMDFHEKLRLLYVACTRARDHLVVSVHRKARDLSNREPFRWTHAELLEHAARRAPTRLLDGEPAGAPAAEPQTSTAPTPVLDPAVWHSEHARAFAQGVKRSNVSATTLAHRVDPSARDDAALAKEPRDLELPPWNKGRYGTAIGRAVHATLQTVDLASGAGIDETASAQAAAEGVLGHEATIAGLARAAIASPAVQRAAARAHWREMYVAVPLDGIVLEGYVDLVYRDDDGLVVVDYKTDSPAPDALESRVAAYRIQAAAYALAVAEATGEPVVRAILTFCAPAGATEVRFEGAELEAAAAEVRVRARAERDDPSPLPAAVPVEA